MMYVDPNDYDKIEDKYEELGFPVEVMAVDMNYGYVPMEVSAESKNSDADMMQAAECNKKRFGL